MSPAKRLSRKRFRALCERCAKWEHGDRGCRLRMVRHIDALASDLLHGGDRRPYLAAETRVAVLARLAR